MRNAVLLCTILLLITGSVSAAGIVPAERMVQNVTVIAPVTTTQTPADTGLVQNLISPVTRLIPGMVTAAPTPVPPSLIIPVKTGLSGPAPTGGIPNQTVKSVALNLVDMQMQKSGSTPESDPCSMSNSNIKVMHGTVYVLMVQDHPVLAQQGVILENDGKLYGIISDNPNFFSLMQTAMVTKKYVAVAAYYEPAPPEGLGGLWPIYRTCWMYVDNS
jgi:hypothetical protein